MPNFQLLFETSLIIQIHTYGAIAALFVGAFVLSTKKGTQIHKNSGRFWVGLMVVVAITSFWISGIKMIGPFSPIHLLSVFALWSVYQGIKQARSGQISAHMKNMKTLYFYAIVGAGFFTLLPGRLMFRVFFG
ncbi:MULTISPECIES: DUF2306 domain-containing protein [unclassified Lentilitoribacter]|jgi:uncharacterized membrane protein|uniref:DUF2306 domain-containing protein n=1 Tax=unclassified Lentilitoribacter TaxID=2647570 RepID=UPI0013A6AFAB|nr:DUF2306 domain-containing protein [Lentilitoribacter sp. Alg239-R112]